MPEEDPPIQDSEKSAENNTPYIPQYITATPCTSSTKSNGQFAYTTSFTGYLLPPYNANNNQPQHVITTINPKYIQKKK